MAKISLGFIANNFNQSGGKYLISVNFTKLVGFGSLNTSYSILVIQSKSNKPHDLPLLNATIPSNSKINIGISYNISLSGQQQQIVLSRCP